MSKLELLLFRKHQAERLIFMLDHKGFDSTRMYGLFMLFLGMELIYCQEHNIDDNAKKEADIKALAELEAIELDLSHAFMLLCGIAIDPSKPLQDFKC